MLTALDDLGIDKVTEAIGEIYNSGEITEGFSNTIFDQTSCECHRENKLDEQHNN